MHTTESSTYKRLRWPQPFNFFLRLQQSRSLLPPQLFLGSVITKSCFERSSAGMEKNFPNISWSTTQVYVDLLSCLLFLGSTHVCIPRRFMSNPPQGHAPGLHKHCCLFDGFTRAKPRRHPCGWPRRTAHFHAHLQELHFQTEWCWKAYCYCWLHHYDRARYQVWCSWSSHLDYRIPHLQPILEHPRYSQRFKSTDHATASWWKRSLLRANYSKMNCTQSLSSSNQFIELYYLILVLYNPKVLKNSVLRLPMFVDIFNFTINQLGDYWYTQI